MPKSKPKRNHLEIVGLLPAGGQATRLAPLPCSKELYPVGFQPLGEDDSFRPKVVCHYLLEKYTLAGANKTYIILREGKWDIPTYLGDGTLVGMNLAYLMMNLPFGTPFTLDQAFPFIQNAMIVFGFPDILFQPDDAFLQLLNRQAITNADIVLGLFPADNPQKVDMVGLDEAGRVREIVIKPGQTDLKYTWIIAVWTPKFTHFMHKYLAEALEIDTQESNAIKSSKFELHVGHVIQAAIAQEINVETVVFPTGSYLDIGTPDDLIKTVCNKKF